MGVQVTIPRAFSAPDSSRSFVTSGLGSARSKAGAEALGRRAPSAFTQVHGVPLTSEELPLPRSPELFPELRSLVFCFVLFCFTTFA